MLGPKKFSREELEKARKKARDLEDLVIEADASAEILCREIDESAASAASEIKSFLSDNGIADRLMLFQGAEMFSPLTPGLTYTTLAVTFRGSPEELRQHPLSTLERAQLGSMLVDFRRMYAERIEAVQQIQFEAHHSLMESIAVEKLDDLKERGKAVLYFRQVGEALLFRTDIDFDKSNHSTPVQSRFMPAREYAEPARSRMIEEGKNIYVLHTFSDKVDPKMAFVNVLRKMQKGYFSRNPEAARQYVLGGLQKMAAQIGVVVVPFRQDLSSCESAADRAAAAMQQEEVLRMMYERKCGECGKTAVCPLYDRARSAYEKHNDKTQWN